MRTFVIAEAGSCHDGSLTTAYELIAVGANAGADACKFQFWSSADQLAARRRVPDAYRDVYRRFALAAAWLSGLAAACRECRVEFMATAYLPEDLPTLAPLVARWKVASFEATDRDFVAAHYVAAPDKPLIISTGMCDQAEVRRLRTETPGYHVSLLHCVSAYPCGPETLNLAVLRSGLFDGFSDHSDPALTWTGALAVAAGARIVEAHLKLDSTDPANPDAPHAMTPAQFTDYVRLIRLAEVALGSGEKRLQPCEAVMSRYRVGGSHE